MRADAHHLGTTADKEEVSGTITVPEVAHDTEEDEYVVRLLLLLLVTAFEADMTMSLV